MKDALAGIKVCDFSWVAAGPVVTTYMAGFGATVVRVESMTRPDTLRTSVPYKDGKVGINRSGYWAFYNANKYSMALNFVHPKALAIAKKLAMWSDIVIENFTPKTIDRLGLGYEELSKEKPELIMISLSMQGQSGPYATHLGLGPLLAGITGVVHLTGWPDRGPVQAGAYSDWLIPDFSLATVLAALLHRDKTGKGQYLDLSQCEGSLVSLAPLCLDYFVNHEEGERSGNAWPDAAPHGCYRCQGDDRWCTIAVFTDDEWNAFCKVIGNLDWCHRPEFATLASRKQNEAELNELVEQWTVKHTAEEVVTLMQEAEVAAGPVETSEDLLKDPQLKFRERFWQMNHPEIGPFQHLGQPYILSQTPAKARMPAPCLGEHTEYVCREILGISDSEFLELFTEGVFE
ncbi:CaiB/BaiF CoA transferase family protein [Chloroflexota bacterium]